MDEVKEKHVICQESCLICRLRLEEASTTHVIFSRVQVFTAVSFTPALPTCYIVDQRKAIGLAKGCIETHRIELASHEIRIHIVLVSALRLGGKDLKMNPCMNVNELDP